MRDENSPPFAPSPLPAIIGNRYTVKLILGKQHLYYIFTIYCRRECRELGNEIFAKLLLQYIIAIIMFRCVSSPSIYSTYI